MADIVLPEIVATLGEHTLNVSPSIRFPRFSCKLNRYTYYSDDFEGKYENDALDEAPSLSALRDASNKFAEFDDMTPGNSYFWRALRAAGNGTIFFLDRYFTSKNLARLAKIATEMSRQQDRFATTISVIMGEDASKKDMQSEYEMLKCEAETANWDGKIQISAYELKSDKGDKIRDLVHDRFVVFDGQFWHFGASAGGMHDCLNAFTGPWPDKNGSLTNLMRELIQHSYKRN